MRTGWKFPLSRNSRAALQCEWMHARCLLLLNAVMPCGTDIRSHFGAVSYLGCLGWMQRSWNS